ncbi:MAG TPA: Holliday junction resolvase RuvX [Saprospiraceae bacterium]|nr:Holliday junction resolvase RuvX [Saprospiraceae bacterium]
MARILGIDYGEKRTGLSATDPLQIIVNGLETVETKDLENFLSRYLIVEEVEKIVIGLPRHKDGNFTHLKPKIDALALYINTHFPSIVIDYEDESFTSSQSRDIIFQSGVKKSKRKDKSLVDKVSAVLILQKYLGHI